MSKSSKSFWLFAKNPFNFENSTTCISAIMPNMKLKLEWSLTRDLTRDTWIRPSVYYWLISEQVCSLFLSISIHFRFFHIFLSFILCNFLVPMLKHFWNFLKKISCQEEVEKTTQKICILMAVGRFFFLCSPNCPKQSRASFMF